jgi:transcriptional regulator with PAS, ATPase and Fis domain
MKQIAATLRKVMDSEIPLLLQGESGTGKEMCARFVHQKSARAGMPFVAINCAAIPPELLESELFGHEKGSFTGAHATVSGKFEGAGTGTIFLDEIGDMSLHLQTKLLRALEERSFEPVGSIRSIPLAARVIASTNSDLAAMIREKRFRLDLYYRLKGVAVTIPPLRDRREDIEPLLVIFLDSFRRRYNKPGVEISREAVRFLRTYQWPGNVRELKNAVESAVLLSDQNRPLLPTDFLLEGTGETALPELWKQEREAIIEVLKRAGYNRSVASQELGMSRKTLYNKMKRYSIK